MQLLGYHILDQIYESNKTVVYRGKRVSDGRQVVLKRLNYNYPSPEKLERFRKEYALTCSLNIEGAIDGYALHKFENGLLMVLEDFGGRSLDQSIKEGPLSLSLFLDLSIRITDIIKQLHQRNVLHKDINPSNIVWNEEQDQLKLIDFGISVQLDDLSTAVREDEGTMAYMPAEQTGRTRHVVDERSDLYTLGVTFFELLTGRLPFEVTDSNELFSCHLARIPPLAHSLRPEVPEVLSAIIQKLMAKEPDQRYQSAFGLQMDLERCREQWQGEGELTSFPLGQKDHSKRIDLSQHILALWPERDVLLERYQEACQGKGQLIFLQGPVGVGKSTLVRQTFRPLLGGDRSGHFLTGQFNSAQQGAPYAALFQALGLFLDQLVLLPTQAQAPWKEALQEALGESGQTLQEALPQLAQLVGDFPPAPQLPPTQAQYRFHLLLKRLLAGLAALSAPLVLFLDELHNADTATLSLLEEMATSALAQHLMIIGAMRQPTGEERDACHLMLERLNQQNCPVHVLTLEALDAQQTLALLSSTFSIEEEKLAPFALACHDKTQGNPFFLEQFLQTLMHQKSFFFDTLTGRWQWNLNAIETQPQTENVITWMADKLTQLSPELQSILPQAACIGSPFPLEVLQAVSEAPEEEVAAAIQEACLEGLLTLDASSLQGLEFHERHGPGESHEKAVFWAHYAFTHERIQQGAYALLEEEERPGVHLRVGMELKRLHEQEREGHKGDIFAIVRQLHAGATLLSAEQRVEAAQLHLRAGRKAQATAAYERAGELMSQGIALLKEGGWQRDHDLALALHTGAAEAAYFCGRFEEMTHIASAVKAHSSDLLEQIDLYIVEIQALISAHQPEEALHLALDVLGQLGVHLPKKPKEYHILFGLMKTMFLLRGKSIESLQEHPPMSDPKQLAAMQLLSRSSLDFAAFLTHPILFPLIVFKQVQLSVQYGHTPDSAVAYVSYGMLLCGITEDFDKGYAFGQLALHLLKAPDAKDQTSKVLKLYNGFIRHWKEPFTATLPSLYEAYEAGRETGYLDSMVGSIFVHTYHSFWSNCLLPSIADTIEQRMLVAKETKQEVHLHYYQMYRQLIHHLQREPEETELGVCEMYTGPFYDGESMYARHHKVKDLSGVFLYHFLEIFSRTLLRQFEGARHHAALAMTFETSAVASIGPPLAHYFHALACLGQWEQASASTKRTLAKTIKRVRKKMKKWAQHTPTNYEHRHSLLEAEWARIKRQPAAAMGHYEAAILGARQQNSLLDEALANEAAGRFHEAHNQSKVAQLYLQDAHHLYWQWGAKHKVRALEKEYPLLQLEARRQRRPAQTRSTTATISTEGISEELDLEAVMKATQTISEEIILGKLLSKLLKMMLENAGAERAFLLLQEEPEGLLRIEASGRVDEDQAQVLQSLPLHEALDQDGEPVLCRELVEHVTSQQQAIILEDAHQQGSFTHLPYMRKKQPRSLLCMPLVHQGKPLGVLYLENNLTPGAFTPERLDLLQVLSSQAAISIENARLYSNLEEKVAERTQQLQDANTQLEDRHKALQEAQSKLIQSEKMASLGTLVSGVAHEFNNKISYTKSGAQNVQRRLLQLLGQIEQLSEDHSQAQDLELNTYQESLSNNLEAIVEGTTALGRLVEDLQTFSQIDESVRQRRRVVEGLEATISLLQTQQVFRQHNIELYKMLQANPVILCWPAQLNQAFMNIMINACQAIAEKMKSDPETKTGYLSISTSTQGRQFLIRFKDNGCGIAPEVQAHIFEPFFTTKAIGEGAGLGLSTAFNIIRAHEGELSVSSQVGNGTTFTISLPLPKKKRKAQNTQLGPSLPTLPSSTSFSD